MASSYRLKNITPNSIFIFAFVASLALFIFSVAAVLHLSQVQHKKLIDYELTGLLRSHGEQLRKMEFRSFVENADLSGLPGKIEISDIKSAKHFSGLFGKESKSFQCSNQPYYQFDVRLCRPNMIPWEQVLLLGGLYLAIVLFALLALVILNQALLASFKNFFYSADLPFPEPLSFSQAWIFAMEMASVFKKLKAQSFEFGQNQAIVQIAAQVAHDIRSPLSALNMVASSLDNITEEKRNLILAVSKRINDIANNLLQKKNLNSGYGHQKKSSALDLGYVLKSIVSEKQIEFSDLVDIKFELEISVVGKNHVNADVAEISRSLSNLLNNAAESLNNNAGLIRVDLLPVDGMLAIKIKDNGRGMSKAVVDNLGTEGFSFGKTGTTSGSGLGFAYARSIVYKIGGRIDVSSREGHGTLITLFLPAA